MPAFDKNGSRKGPVGRPKVYSVKRNLSGSRKAIGVFDSGLGGLTVVKELMRQLPGEDIVYYGDTARVPYGTKSKDTIIRYSMENTRILLRCNVKMIVVACNSSSSYALAALQEKFNIPILGVIGPGARKAAETTRSQRVGVIATSATINSGAYAQAIRHHNPRIDIFSQACPLFVPLVEEGWLNKEVTRIVAQEYLADIRKARVDTLILGCTHYPLLKPVLKKILGEKVTLVDSAKETAREVKERLAELSQEKSSRAGPRHTFLVSDKPQQFKKIAEKFLGQEIKRIDTVEEAALV